MAVWAIFTLYSEWAPKIKVCRSKNEKYISKNNVFIFSNEQPRNFERNPMAENVQESFKMFKVFENN